MNLRPVGLNQTELHFANGTVVFFSYETPVAALIPDPAGKKMLLTNQFYSVTTSRHITQWFEKNPGHAWESVDPTILESILSKSKLS